LSAPINPAKRKEIETNVIKTFYLSNVATPTELQDLVNAMRQILESRAYSSCPRRTPSSFAAPLTR